ncbi:hypothetical protein AMK20_25100 [Streptomyces sp. TSRI0261]|nr:hypothetical protein AMK20_25100 [Streptomyces sp. TSRI0261]
MLDKVTAFEARSCADEGDEVGRLPCPPAGLGGLDELEGHGQGGCRAAAPPRVTLVRSRTVENVDSIGFVVRRWIQCSAGKS